MALEAELENLDALSKSIIQSFTIFIVQYMEVFLIALSTFVYRPLLQYGYVSRTFVLKIFDDLNPALKDQII